MRPASSREERFDSEAPLLFMPSDLRTFSAKFLASVAPDLEGRAVIVGRSGGFLLESLLQATAKPAALHSNDMDFLPCMTGRWLAGRPLDFEVIDPDFDWLAPYLDTDDRMLAALMVLTDMNAYRRQNNAHAIRMWAIYREQFDALVGKTLGKLADVGVKLASFTDGPVLPHFKAHADDPDAIFACYAPGYTGPRDSFRAIDDLVNWDDPDCDRMDEPEADSVLAFLKGRKYLWFDSRDLPGLTPVVMERAGKDLKGRGPGMLYLYSNLTNRNAYYAAIKAERPLTLPMADATTEITRKSKVVLQRISTSDLSHFKDAFLGKHIQHAPGQWAFAVYAGPAVIGFIEFAQARFGDVHSLYLQADFPVSSTRYRRLSKLISMLALSGETRRVMERITEKRITEVVTTAFTEKQVSMKYRGVLDVVKRGQREDGSHFVNYRGEFNDLSWRRTLGEWYQKHGQIFVGGADEAGE